MNRQSKPSLRKRKGGQGSLCTGGVIKVVLTICGVLGLLIGGLLLEASRGPPKAIISNSGRAGALRALQGDTPPLPKILPIFAPVPNAQQLINDVLKGKPSIAGIAALLQQYIFELHQLNRKLSAERANAGTIVERIFQLTSSHLGKFDAVYRGRPIFPIDDEDDTIFLSLAAFREHLLADTMVYAFKNAAQPSKLFVGVIVQNCFGAVGDDGITVDPSGLPCRTGVEVVGKQENGRPKTKVSDAPPDKNGIEEFCAMPDYKHYCDNGQVRVIYVHETESLGPAAARYYASKLWAGETFFMQCDSHLMFADHWDDKYRAEIRATTNYPKSILSSYPPGFDAVQNGVVTESKGARLCVCMTMDADPNPIIRINTGVGYHGSETKPTEIPFIAAGFFFAHANFLVDVPFDPFMPWLFMGEEIALSMRAWTHGWNVYAPRKNLIAHQYRPGRMGLPKYWESVNRLYRGAADNSKFQRPVIKRVKYMVGYPDSALETIKAEGIELVLEDIEHYGLGQQRSWQEYMDYAHMHVDQEKNIIRCTNNEWCNKGLKD